MDFKTKIILVGALYVSYSFAPPKKGRWANRLGNNEQTGEKQSLPGPLSNDAPQVTAQPYYADPLNLLGRLSDEEFNRLALCDAINFQKRQRGAAARCLDRTVQYNDPCDVSTDDIMIAAHFAPGIISPDVRNIDHVVQKSISPLSPDSNDTLVANYHIKTCNVIKADGDSVDHSDTTLCCPSSLNDDLRANRREFELLEDEVKDIRNKRSTSLEIYRRGLVMYNDSPEELRFLKLALDEYDRRLEEIIQSREKVANEREKIFKNTEHGKRLASLICHPKRLEKQAGIWRKFFSGLMSSDDLKSLENNPYVISCVPDRDGYAFMQFRDLFEIQQGQSRVKFLALCFIQAFHKNNAQKINIEFADGTRSTLEHLAGDQWCYRQNNIKQLAKLDERRPAGVVSSVDAKVRSIDKMRPAPIFISKR